MALFFNESDVDRLLSVSAAVNVINRAFFEWGSANAENLSRRRLHLPGGTFHLMAGALPVGGYLGLKAYTSWSPKTRFYVMLFSAENGELLAMMEADILGQRRTGAASGVASKVLARENSRTAAGRRSLNWKRFMWRVRWSRRGFIVEHPKNGLNLRARCPSDCRWK